MDTGAPEEAFPLFQGGRQFGGTIRVTKNAFGTHGIGGRKTFKAFSDNLPMGPPRKGL